MALKKKEIENIYVDNNIVYFIIKNTHISTSFSRSLNPMIKKAFKKWLQNPQNRQEVGWTYISRYRLIPIRDFNLGYQDEEKQYFRYLGAVEVL